MRWKAGNSSSARLSAFGAVSRRHAPARPPSARLLALNNSCLLLPAQAMEPSSIRVPWSITFILNLLFLIGALCLMIIVVAAAVNPPVADIGPKRVNEYPQFLITIGILAVFGWCLFALHFLGVIATCIKSSFLLSILHKRLETTYQELRQCTDASACDPVRRFQSSEMLLIIFFSTCTLLQVALLIASSVLCERISYKELLHAQLEREKEEDEEERFLEMESPRS